MSTWPNTDVLWCEHWHDRADRRAWRVDAPRQTPDAAARPAITNSNPSAEWAERRTRTASRCTCVCVHYAPVPHRCARHSSTCACALCAPDESIRSRAICSTLRPAGEIVHEEARGEGARYSASSTWAVASLPAGSASADGKHRRHKQRGERWGARQEGWGGCEAAGGVHLPLPRLVGCELPIPFRELLRRVPARARLLRFSVSAVRRSAALPAGLDGPVGAAEQQLRDG